MRKRTKLVAAVSGLVLTAVLVPAVPALAATGTFGNCTLTSNAPSLNGAAINVSGATSCSTSSTRALRLNLMHNYDFLPDAEAAGRTFAFTKSISKTTAFCDPGPKGKSTTYFTQNVNYNNKVVAGSVDSSNRVLSGFC